MPARIAVAVILAVGVVTAAVPVSAATIKVMTYNTNNGGAPDGQMDTIAAQSPDVVVLQEASYTQLPYYVDGLNARLHTTAWHGAYAKHCKYGTQPTCTTVYDGSVMVLTRLTTLATNSTLIWAADDYVVARATIRMRVALSDGTPADVFVCHLPAVLGGSFTNAESARDTFVTAFRAWAKTFTGAPQLVGGDFNDHPGWTAIQNMTQTYEDGWATGGSGAGYTHTNPTVTTRLDYWFSHGAALSSVAVIADTTHSDHRPVVASYSLSSSPSAPPPPPPTTETTILSDAFATADRTKWPGGVFTGTTDSTIPVGVTTSGLQIGALKASLTGSHYNGISSGAYNLSSNGSAYVQLVKSPNTATTAYAMFALASDADNFYRWYESGNALVAEKRIGGVKTALVDLPYSVTSHQFLRIRNEYNASTGVKDVVFETAPNNAGTPGTWIVRYRETWNGSVALSSIRFELKAGTSEAVTSPGSAWWGHFRAAINTP